MKGPDGKSVFNGRTVTCFSNEEEGQVGLLEAIPFLVESDIRVSSLVLLCLATFPLSAPDGPREKRLPVGEKWREAAKVANFRRRVVVIDSEEGSSLICPSPLLQAKGGNYVHAAEAWAPHVVTDRNGGILITGSNPASATATGEALVAALKA